MAPSTLLTLIMVPLIAFGMYRRVRKLFGRQLVTPRRMKARMVMFVLVATLLLATLPTLPAFGAAFVGLLVGGGLALFGLRHTQFEKTSDGTFYTPNKWIGLGVTALFFGRIVARTFVIYEVMAQVDAGTMPNQQLHRSALTVGIFFLLATYYVGTYTGVLRTSRALEAVTVVDAVPGIAE